MKATERRDSLMAAVATFVAVALILAWLLLASLHYDEALATESNPNLEQDEIFIDPELLLAANTDAGDPDSKAEEAPAPDVKGEPVPAPVEETRTVNASESTTPSSEQKLVASGAESPVQTAAPDKKKEEQKVAASMAGKFNSNPGAAEGKFDSPAGSGGVASGVSGKMSGRKFLGCPLPDVALSHKTTVTVSITVDAEGRVMTATASGAASREIRRKCEQAAMQAKWSPKKGAASTRGSLTFTIIPK